MTIRDLALSLGLAESTVSKALNDRGDVSPAVKNRVKEAAQALGYIPNPAARRLALGQSRTLGVFLLNRFDRPAGEYFGFNFLGGLMKAAQARGYDLLLFQESEELTTMGYLEYARRKGVEGAILIGLWAQDAQTESLYKGDLPWVSIDTPVPGSPRGFVSTDNRQGQTLALEALWNLGHRRIGFIGIQGEGYVAAERRAAYEEFCKSRGIWDSKILEETALNVESGFWTAHKLLVARKRPTALVCASDLQALGALQAAAQLELRVPRDLSVTGFDNIPASLHSSPPLSTVAQDSQAIGEAAFESLLSESPRPEPRLLPASLLVRGSIDYCTTN